MVAAAMRKFQDFFLAGVSVFAHTQEKPKAGEKLLMVDIFPYHMAHTFSIGSLGLFANLFLCNPQCNWFKSLGTLNHGEEVMQDTKESLAAPADDRVGLEENE